MAGKKWKVNDGTQVAIGDKMYVGGDTFTATDEELDEHGSRAYVSEVRQQSQPKAANKAVAKPESRQAASDGKTSGSSSTVTTTRQASDGKTSGSSSNVTTTPK